VVDLLGKGERDFWMLFVPMIAGLVLGAGVSGRLAGRIRVERVVDGAIGVALVAAAVNIGLATVSPTLPYAVVAPGLIALAVATAFPVLQLLMLDLFPHHRGAAASMATFATLVFNSLLAGVISPYVTRSVLVLALSSGGFAVVGAALWAWHRLVGTAEHRGGADLRRRGR
jgi:DHA1 family bicyclomycin/chloramphenicol resistance-like MFS transporter